MMNRFSWVALFVCLMVLPIASSRGEEKITSGPQPDQRIGAFNVVKYAGNDHDGVKVGEELCYRCKLGRRPVVAIFSRRVNPRVVTLVKRVDAVVASNEAKEMASFVNLLGDDPEKLGEEAKKLVKDSEAKNIAVVVPVESKNGNKQLGLSEDAEVTVLIYKNGIIKANYAFKSGALDDSAIDQIVKNTGVILD